MTEEQYLLVCTAKQGAEITSRASQALMFGLDNVESGHEQTRERELWEQIDGLHGVLELLIEQRGQGGNTREAINARKAETKRMMRLSRALGTLKRNGNEPV